MTMSTKAESGIVESQVRLCKRSIDTCRRRNIAGEEIPKTIMNAMSNLSHLVYNWISSDEESETYLE